MKNKIDKISDNGELKLLNYKLVAELEDVYKAGDNNIVDVDVQDEELRVKWRIWNI